MNAQQQRLPEDALEIIYRTLLKAYDHYRLLQSRGVLNVDDPWRLACGLVTAGVRRNDRDDVFREDLKDWLDLFGAAYGLVEAA